MITRTIDAYLDLEEYLMEPEDRMRTTWERGSYDDVARNYLSMAGHLVERATVDSDDDVLDVGCGTGNAAITAARRDARVTGIDITPVMIERARENAEIAGVENVDWRTGTATNLPFEENAFDVTLSCLGHMYADPPDATTEELMRVTRQGGRIAFTSWTPTDLFPFLAGVLSTYVPPEELPEFSEPPFAWGDSEVVTDRLGDAVTELEFETETMTYPALSPEHFWQELSTKSGTFIEFLELVDEEDRPPLCDEMIETIRAYFDNRENAIELQYLLTTARL